MGITQVLQGCGAWDLKWKDRLPASVRNSIGDGSTLVVFPAHVVNPSDDIRDTALFEGVMTELSTDGASGWELSWFMGKPNGDGPERRLPDGVLPLTYQTRFEDAVDGVNGVSYDVGSGYNGLYSGIWGPAAGPDTALPPTSTVREFADSMVDSVTEYRRRFGFGEQFSWKIGPGLTLMSDDIENLFDHDRCVISPAPTDGVGDGGLRNVYADIRVTRSIENVATDLVAYGDRNSSTGVTPTETLSLSLDVNAPDGGDLEFRRQIDSGGAQYDMERTVVQVSFLCDRPIVSVEVQLRGDPWQRWLSPGDRVYVWAPDEPDLVDSGNEVHHFGVINPKSFYVEEVTRNVGPDAAVWFRNPIYAGAGPVWVDVSDYVVRSSQPASVRVTEQFVQPFRRDGNYAGGPLRSRDSIAVARRLRRSSN